jgi:hypothetical protein
MITSFFGEVQLVWEGWSLPGSFLLLTVLTVVGGLHLLHVTLSKQQVRAKDSPVPPKPAQVRAASVPEVLFKRPAPPPVVRTTGKKSRRSGIRRSGNPVDVKLSDATATAEPKDAQVLDRSRGGLLLSVGHAIAAGTMLTVRANLAPDDTPWVQIEVRHCRAKRDRWVLGCAFKEELPWSVLLLFG